jgi:hypothetical protein
MIRKTTRRPRPELLLAVVLTLVVGLGAIGTLAQETEPEPEPETPVVTEPSPSEAPAVREDPAPEDRPRTTRRHPMRIGGTNFDLGGDIVIPEGIVHRGDVVSIGGTVVIEGEVTRQVTVIGGTLVVSGTVGREVVAVLSTVELGPDAHLERGIINVLGSLEDAGAWIDGDFVNLDPGLRLPNLRAPLGVLALILNWALLLRVALVFISILLFVALVPDRVQRISDAFPRRFILAFLAGAAFFIIGFPLVLTLLAVSVLGALAIPFAILAYVVLTWLGMAGIFHFVGVRIGRLFGREMSLLGATLLGFAVVAVLHVLPFLAGYVWAGFTWLILTLLIVLWLLLGWLGFGMLLVTRFGAPPRLVAPPAPPPPSPPPPPATPPDPGGRD